MTTYDYIVQISDFRLDFRFRLQISDFGNVLETNGENMPESNCENMLESKSENMSESYVVLYIWGGDRSK